jgi:hypothetical protein
MPDKRLTWNSKLSWEASIVSISAAEKSEGGATTSTVSSATAAERPVEPKGSGVELRPSTRASPRALEKRIAGRTA